MKTILVLALILSGSVLARPSFKKADIDLHTPSLEFSPFKPQFNPGRPQVLPAQRRPLAEEWEVSKKNFVETMENGGKESLANRLGKKEKRTSEEEALFRTYNKLKANGKAPTGERLAKEVYHLHLLEIVASYEYLKPKFLSLMTAKLKTDTLKNLENFEYDRLLKDLKRANPKPTPAQLEALRTTAEANVKAIEAQVVQRLEADSTKLVETYLLNLVRGITSPTEVNPEKVFAGGVIGKGGLNFHRSLEMLGTYVKPEHPYLKKQSKTLGKLFSETQTVELTAAEEKLPEEQKRVVRSTKLAIQKKELLEDAIGAFLVNDDTKTLFGPLSD